MGASGAASNVTAPAGVNATVVGAPVRVAPAEGKSKTVTAKQVLDYAAASLHPSKMPRQLQFLISAEELPKTRTGKYMRVGLHAKLKLDAVDLNAQKALASSGGEAIESESIPPPVRPHPAIYGVRFVFAIWVVFIHVGNFPREISVWRSLSISMTGFFILAGFLLTASTKHAVTDKASFYRNRIIAAHPLYLLALAFSIVVFYIACQTTEHAVLGESCGDPANAGFQAIWGVISVFMNVFAQNAWPWGLIFNMYNGPLWFSSAYYFCIFSFPFVYNFMMKHKSYTMQLLRPAGTVACFGCICWSSCCTWIILAGILAVATGDIVLGFMVGYMFPPIWLMIFSLGMILFLVFEFNRRQAGAKVWPSPRYTSPT